MMVRREQDVSWLKCRTVSPMLCFLLCSLIAFPAWGQSDSTPTTVPVPLAKPWMAPPASAPESLPDWTPPESTSFPEPPSSPWPSPGLEVLRQAVGAVEALGSPGEDLPVPEEDPKETQSRQFILPMKDGAADNIHVQDDQGLISLVVRDAPLRQVVAMVAETQNLNIVFASPAEVPVTASFDGVPWQQVIESLLAISGHTWTMNEGIISVTSIEAASFVSPQAGGRVVEVFELDFASAVDVDNTVKGLLSPAGNSWLVETSSEDNRRTREVVAVFDYPANVARISDYICQMDQPPRQVLIEANILQVELNDDCRSGVNFEQITSFNNNKIGFGFLSAGLSDPGGKASGGGPNSTAFLTVDGTALNGFVQLLESTLDAKTLASPKLLTVSGQISRIQIGDQLGYSTVTTNVNQTTQQNVQFLETGVILTVTPRITRDGRVMLKVKPEVSTGQINPSTQVPDAQTTNVESSILLSDGQGMVIGGLIQEEDVITESKLPWFGDLPYVGILFQNRQTRRERKEIIVTLIPHIQPYNPIVNSREANDYMRTQDRLLTGPLCRVPRPYEARLYDTFLNPRRPMATLHASHYPVPNSSMAPVDMPPVGDENGWQSGPYNCPDNSSDILFPQPQPGPSTTYHQ